MGLLRTGSAMKSSTARDTDHAVIVAILAVAAVALVAAFFTPISLPEEKALAFVRSGEARVGAPVYVDKHYSALKARLCKAQRIDHWKADGAGKVRVLAHRCPWEQL